MIDPRLNKSQMSVKLGSVLILLLFLSLGGYILVAKVTKVLPPWFVIMRTFQLSNVLLVMQYPLSTSA